MRNLNAISVLLLLLGIAAPGCGSDDATSSADASGDDQRDAIGDDDAAGPDSDEVLPDAGTTDVGNDEDAVPTDVIDASSPVTYHGEVRAIVEQKCVSCHTEGGMAGIALDSWAQMELFGPAAVAAVETGRMPPWMPADDCHPLAGDRSLSDDQLATLLAWRAQGYPEGDPADYVAPEVPVDDLGEPDVVTSAGFAFAPDRALPDDYHCFVLDAEFETDTYINATDILPDKQAIVHHVLLYLVEPGDVAQLDTMNADGRGYTCFGGPAVGNSVTLAGWVPGSVPVRYPENSGILVPAGSKIVMQVHYNTSTIPASEEIPADQTSALFWTLEPGVAPERLISIVPVANTRIRIPAGEPEHVETLDYPSPLVATLIGVAPHMHTLGKSISVRIQRGDQEMCAIDIPQWDFGWQQFYRFADDQHMTVLPGDNIELTCVYDNSAANQPIVNGEQLEPRDVRWGEGTFDEMCLNYLIIAQPWYPAGDGVCGAFEPCYDDCAEGDSDCFLSCMANGTSLDCAGCMLGESGRQCVTEYCASSSGPFFRCVVGCDTEFECIFSECLEEFDVLHDCLEPYIRDGSCDPYFAECGVTMAD